MFKSLANNRANNRGAVTGQKWQTRVRKPGQAHRRYSAAELVSFICVFLALAAMAPAVADVPVLGGLLVFLVLVAGIGGWVVRLHQRNRGEASRGTGTVNV